MELRLRETNTFRTFIDDQIWTWEFYGCLHNEELGTSINAWTEPRLDETVPSSIAWSMSSTGTFDRCGESTDTHHGKHLWN